MASRTGADDSLAKEKRVKKSKEIFLSFISDEKTEFEVRDPDTLELKYTGTIDPKGNDHFCSCPSHKFGMKFEDPDVTDNKETSLYYSEHGYTFRCKHLMKAWETRQESLNANS